MAELQTEIQHMLAAKKPQQNRLISQLRKEFRAVDGQIASLATMLPEVKHCRPLIQRIDTLEDEP